MPGDDGEITGMKWDDRNGNGQKDAGEPGLSGWTIFIDSDNNAALDVGEPTATTNANGNYAFVGLTVGSYVVREDQQQGWTQTSPPAGGAHNVTLAADQVVSNVDFGNNEDSGAQEWDFGDAPDTYLTTDAVGGHKHKIDDSGPFLGDTDSHKPDAESDGQPSAGADLDDTNSVSPHTDEESTALWAIIRQVATSLGTSGEVDLALTGVVSLFNAGPADGIVDGWIDLDQNGTFDATEHFINGETLVSGLASSAGQGLFEFSWIAPSVIGPTTLTYDFVSRFRISRAGSSTPGGAADDGEVEDHKVTFTISIPNTVPQGTFKEEDIFEATHGTLTLLGPNMPTGGAQVGVSGPTTVHVFFEGHEEGDALDNTLLRPGQSQDGLDEVQTEIISMNLTGEVPGLGLPVAVRLNPDRRSTGMMTETINEVPGRLDVEPFTTPITGQFQIDSFFDVFVEVEVGQPGLTGHMILHNKEPIRIGSTITRKPPREGETYTGGDANNPIPLHHPNGEPSGFSLGPISHTPYPVPTTGSIHGWKWNDLNGDGVHDAGEPGLAGIPIIAYQDGSPVASIHTMVDDTSTTNDDETGMYWLENLLPGDYEIRESVDPSQWMQTYPNNWKADLNHDSSFNNSSQTGASGSASFIRQPDGSIEWWLFWDGTSGPPTNAHIHLTADGAAGGGVIQNLWTDRDASEDTPNSAHGVIINPSSDLIDKMNNDNAYVNIHTAANGAGEVAGLIVGDGSHHVNVVAGEEVQNVNFLNRFIGDDEEWDFGDLPDTGAGTATGNYKTLESNDGARHKKLDDTIIIGHEWDGEDDGQPTANADGDDTTPAGGPDDEDGVTFTTSLTIGSTATVEAEFSGTISSGRFDGWIDFNADGDFDDSGEHVVTNSSVGVGPPIAFSFAVPAGATVGTTYARFRVRTGTDPIGWFGPRDSGEVQDYKITIEDDPNGGDPTLDYGDAPDTATGTGAGNYNTLSSDDGPSHVATGPMLGTERDTEQDAHQSADADGDDTTPAGGPDDEDGITFGGPLTPGGTVDITFVVNGIGATDPFVDGWIDFNNNGVFETSELVLNGSTPHNGNGTPSTETITVPASAQTGETYARFRISTSNTPLLPTGATNDGEVEDYKITIEAAQFVDLEITSVSGGVAEDPTSGPGLYAITFLYEVCNNGNTAVGPFDVLLQFDGTTFGTAGHSSLGAGACANDPGQLIYNGLSVAPGDHTLTVTADPSNGITESDENNNSRDLTSTVVQLLDFGDAPDTYGTLLASDGARHDASLSPVLGEISDPEDDGHPTPGADGDDFNDFDDEDGVTISALIAGATATVDATEGTGSNGFVSAWIDFDGNGTFDDPAERIIDNGFVPGGTTETFTFTVPASAVADSTYARFRIVTETTGPGPTGLWPNGEVEDYAVTIGAAPPTGTIIDDGDPGFTSSNDWDPSTSGFQGDSRFTVAPNTNTETATWTFNVAPGNYRVSATWTPDSDRVQDAPFTVFDGTINRGTLRLDQQIAPDDRSDGGADWEDLGIFPISESTLIVTLTNDTGTGRVVADAIRIESVSLPVSQIIDDSNGFPSFESTGTFTQQSDSAAWNGGIHLAPGAPGTGGSEADWNFSLNPGIYRVSTTWTSSPDRATDSPFTISDGTLPLGTVDVNQQLSPNSFGADGKVWEDLGIFTVGSGVLNVQLANDADGFVIADAIRIEQLP